MSDRFTFSSAGIVHELELAMDRVGGWNAALVKRMCEGDRLAEIREYLLGQAEITYPEHLINCDAAPFVPQGWEMAEHRKTGIWKWDPAKVAFHLSKRQERGSFIEGNKLLKELEEKPVLNANVLDYLLAHQELIPESWKKDENGNIRYIFFWGTIYRRSGGRLGVRYLYWDGCRWHWDCGWLAGGFRDQNPAALRAS